MDADETGEAMDDISDVQSVQSECRKGCRVGSVKAANQSGSDDLRGMFAGCDFYV